LSIEEWKRNAKEILELLKIKLKYDNRVPIVILLVGIPGSGKTTFSKNLIQKNCAWMHVSQDELKTSRMCKLYIEEGINRGMNIVIDRCNKNTNLRISWIEDVKKLGVHTTIAIHFDIDRNEAKSRVMKRVNHPTLPAVEKSKQVVDEIADCLTKPQLNEGFAEIICVRTEKDVSYTIERFASINQ